MRAGAGRARCGQSDGVKRRESGRFRDHGGPVWQPRSETLPEMGREFVVVLLFSNLALARSVPLQNSLYFRKEIRNLSEFGLSDLYSLCGTELACYANTSNPFGSDFPQPYRALIGSYRNGASNSSCIITVDNPIDAQFYLNYFVNNCIGRSIVAVFSKASSKAQEYSRQNSNYEDFSESLISGAEKYQVDTDDSYFVPGTESYNVRRKLSFPFCSILNYTIDRCLQSSSFQNQEFCCIP